MYVGVFYFSHKVGGTYLNICSFDISNRSIEECVYHRCFICVKSQSLSPREIAFTPSDCIEQIFADITARTSHEHTSKLTTRQVAVLLRKLFCGLKIFKRLFWRTHFVLNVKKTGILFTSSTWLQTHKKRHESSPHKVLSSLLGKWRLITQYNSDGILKHENLLLWT